MEAKEKYARHYEEQLLVPSSAEKVFAYADDHTNFSSHMNQSSWMMAGGSMHTTVDEGKGQRVGSHIRMKGNILGLHLFLDEVIIEHNPPFRKSWKTIGDINLIVIDHYKLGFTIEPHNDSSKITVYIDYNLPKSFGTRLLGSLFGDIYAQWCVHQMIQGVKEHGTSK